MKTIKKFLNGVIVLKFETQTDSRGHFLKFFQKEKLYKKNIKFNVKEIFISKSKKNVIRGMHFDKLSKKNDKIVLCNKGSVLDVFLDVRKNSKSFGKYSSFKLHENDNYMIYIPTGFAHGFLSLKDNSELIYLSSKNYNPIDEKGYLWNSFGFQWPVSKPIISKRDTLHPDFLKL